MSSGLPPSRGIPPPVMVLCRQCVQYVFEGTIDCPHCGRDISEIGPKYAEGNYLAIETMQRIDRLVNEAADRHATDPPPVR